MNSKEIKAELLAGCPEESLEDHEAIGEALSNGDSPSKILAMPEADRWPETYSWLKSKFSNRTR